jgi:plasmid stabilization system protein ParE
VHLHLTESAERDLGGIGHFIARDNPADTARFNTRLEDRVTVAPAMLPDEVIE